jgi:hypothetical protein
MGTTSEEQHNNVSRALISRSADSAPTDPLPGGPTDLLPIHFAGIPLLHDFYRARKFNKISDVIRHKAILEQGGIYLDTDFQVSPQW